MKVYRSAALLAGPQLCYRYWLKRVIGRGRRTIVWVMLNPSTADASKDDATIRRVLRFSKDWGFDIVIVVNCFALRARDPQVIHTALVKRDLEDVMGPDNSFWINYWVSRAQRLVIGWGNNMTFEPAEIVQTFPHAVCLGLTKSLQPKHPLMIAANTEPEFYEQAYSHALAQVPNLRPRKSRRLGKHTHQA